MNEKFQYRTKLCECGIENFECIVSKRVQVNPNNSRAMSVLTLLLFKENAQRNRQTLSQPKPWSNDSGVLISRGTNQPIRKSDWETIPLHLKKLHYYPFSKQCKLYLLNSQSVS